MVNDSPIKRPLISVIVPIYNVEPYLREALDSLLFQTYKNLEIILIDDGSTDGCGRICDEYSKKDARVRVIHQNNGGLSAARNTGLDACRGEIISFMDSDDAFHKNMLARMYEAMKSTGADIVECNFSMHKCSGKMPPWIDKVFNRVVTFSKWGKEGVYDRKTALGLQIDGIIQPMCWNKIYRRKIWENLRFTEGQNFEDTDIILNVIERAETFCRLKENLIMHRKRPGSITATHSLKNLIDMSKAHVKYAEYIMEHVPDYFDDKDIMLVKQRNYATLLADYFIISMERNDSIKAGYRDKYLRYLKRMILETRDVTDIERCSFRVRVADYMYHNTPAVIPGLIYRIYIPIRRLIFMMIHR